MEGPIFNSTTMVVILMTLLSTTISSISCAKPHPNPNTNTQFIKTSCGATTYPKLCFSSLSAYASDIHASPELIAGTALSVALDTAMTTSTMMLKLSKTHGMKPMEVGAMHDCVEELSDSVTQIAKSIGEMKEMSQGSGFDLMISDVKTWVSAALTEESTCMDGFEGNAMNGRVKNVVRGKIVYIAQLTSNALALVNRFAALHA